MRDSGRKFHIIRIVVGSSLLLALVAALAWNVWGAIAGSVGSSEFKEDPCSQFEEPAAFNACVEPYVEKYKQEQADFRQRFAASGQDTHTLRSVQRPLENTYIVDPKRLLDESDLIIRGTVVSQTLGGDYGGGRLSR